MDNPESALSFWEECLQTLFPWLYDFVFKFELPYTIKFSVKI